MIELFQFLSFSFCREKTSFEMIVEHSSFMRGLHLIASSIVYNKLFII